MQNSSANHRETSRHYIAASEHDLQAMLKAIGQPSLDALYSHIPESVRFNKGLDLPEELDYEALKEELSAIAKRNHIRSSFLGDGLQDLEPAAVIAPICEIRNLTTAYTPYQPELSQGTLLAHWIYQCSMARLTGFEAVNASLYDRSSAIFEGICAAMRMQRGKSIALIPETLYPGDLEVLDTVAAGTDVILQRVPVNAETGCLEISQVRAAAEGCLDKLAAIVFPQVNTFGLLEAVDALTDLAAEFSVKSVAVIDPLHLAPGGLKAPTEFGANGADIIVGEAHHLALAPNYGGPGLGLFGVRFSAKDRSGVRAAPGRFIGKAFEVERIYLLSKYSRKGYGRKAFENIFKIGRKKGYEKIWLGVWEYNKNAIEFYKHMGFKMFSKHSFLSNS